MKKINVQLCHDPKRQDVSGTCKLLCKENEINVIL